jgi:ATP-binding cassette subfamily B protein
MSDSKPPDFSEAFEGYEPDDDSREENAADLDSVDPDSVDPAGEVLPSGVPSPLGQSPSASADESETPNLKLDPKSGSTAGDQERGRPEVQDSGSRGQYDSDDSMGEDVSSMKHTAVQCLSLLARHHGLEVSPKRLIHDYSLEEEEPKVRRLLRIAQDNGLKAKHARMTWKQFGKMEQAFPAIGKLNNGNYVILVGLRLIQNDDGTESEQMALFDPLADQSGFVYLDQEKFESAWKGEVILAKRKYSLLDQKQPFSLRWFLPEIIRQRTAFTDVAVAAFFIHLIALVVPLFFSDRDR